MRNLFLFSLILILSAGLGACSKKSGSSGQVVVAARVNGVSWGAADYSVTFTKVPELDVIIHAVSGNTAINFQLDKYTGIGTYPVLSSDNSYFFANNVFNHADSGQVVITDSYSDGNNHTIIKGNFNFSADNNTTVADGVFEVALNLE